LRVEVGVPESLPRVAIGSDVIVQIGGVEIQGKLAEVAPAADATARTFLVKIDLPANVSAGAAAVQSGQFARVAWAGEKSTALVVPESAVTRFGQMERVFVAGSDGRASLRIVKTGRRINDPIYDLLSGRERSRLEKAGAQQKYLVEILAGLSAGEKVVVEGAQTLRDGQPLEVQP